MPAPIPASEIAALFLAQEHIIGRGMAVLAVWSLLNLIGSGYFVSRADRRFEPYFCHGMNVGWGAVNAALTCWGVLHLHFTAPLGLRLVDLFQAQLSNENLFILNSGLDVAYLMTGFYLRAQARVPGGANPTRLLGFGRSLWLQGGFLFVFDVVMWSAVHWQGRELLILLA